MKKKKPLKITLIFLKESFTYISGNGTFLYFLKVFLTFLEMKLSSLKNKKFQERTFPTRKNKKNTPWKNSQHSGKWNFLALRFLYLKDPLNSYIFLYFRKRNFLKNLFQEVTLRARKIKKNHIWIFLYIFQEMELSSHKLKKHIF